MNSNEVSEEDLARIPRLASSCDPTSLTLTPAEGFLLSRIDGQTSWKLLREIGGLTPVQVDLCVEEWLSRGLIDIDGRAPRVRRRKKAIPESAKQRAKRVAAGIDESLIDPSLEIDEDIQRDVLEFEMNLDRDYFAILGVEVGADDREIKRAYFGLSKRFHPDRFFRRKIEHYGPRLERIFKRVSEAYELLQDPVSREEVERTIISQQAAAKLAQSAPKGGRGEAPKLSPFERLQQRMPFRVSQKIRDEKSAKGDELFKSAQSAEKLGRLAEAASNMRLAVAFDPFNGDYKRALGELQAKVALNRIQELMNCPKNRWNEGDRGEAQRLAEEALLYRPRDAAANDLAARLYLMLDDPERAFEYSSRAVKISPEDGAYRRTRAMVHRDRGNKGHAISDLEKVLELNSSDMEARKMLDALRMKPRRH